MRHDTARDPWRCAFIGGLGHGHASNGHSFGGLRMGGADGDAEPTGTGMAVSANAKCTVSRDRGSRTAAEVFRGF
jgi:hypothetical protein